MVSRNTVLVLMSCLTLNLVACQSECGTNEVFLNCKKACPPDTCDIRYISVLCSAYQPCSPGCTCAPGYLRSNSTGPCIPEDTCLPAACAQDINAVANCGNRCGKTCIDYQARLQVCPTRACDPNGCGCREGYVYDAIMSRCVLPENCSNQCPGPNERLSNCYEGECAVKYCTQVGKPIACAAVASCNPGCICVEGYVRDASGNCIKESECTASS